MAASAGKDILIQINTSGSTYTNLMGLRTRSMKFNSEMIDVTTGDSPGLWRESLSTDGIKSATISGSGVAMDDVAFNKVFTNHLSTTATYSVRVIIPGLGQIDGTFVFASIEIAGNHNGEVTYNVTIESGGALTFAAS